MRPEVNICWFRRDLRVYDNAALYHALKSDRPVVPIFIFDREILDELKEDPNALTLDHRVIFIHRAVHEMNELLGRENSAMHVYYGSPADIFRKLLEDYKINQVFTNHDYEPYAKDRDAQIAALLQENGVAFKTFKDQVIFEKSEVIKDDGKPYTVFTPYSRKWKAIFNDFYRSSYPVEKYTANYYTGKAPSIPSLNEMGFADDEKAIFPTREWRDDMVRGYPTTRDIPSIPGTTRLSVHLRFGTISVRQLAREAGSLNETFLNELIWRDFYQCILWHFPHVVGHAFRPEYDKIQWRNNEAEYDAWREGRTGYPIVDAGIRELNETGFMHNRVRMVVASFLVKHLLIDWRWGEAYFAKKLLDYDLASNNGGWQWASGSGCDAAPYFRIFNPYLQTKKFDPQLKYIRKWVPELDSLTYPLPIVEHEYARKRCLETYAKALKK